MKKLVYALIISILLISIMVVGSLLLKKTYLRDATPVKALNEEVQESVPQTEPSAGVKLEESQREDIPETAKTISDSASEYKNFEDTIDSLIEITN